MTNNSKNKTNFTCQNLEVFFSVIVCCYNPSIEKLKKTLTSIEKQRGVSFNVIISDDGSFLSYEADIKQWAMEHHYFNILYNFCPKNMGTIANILSALSLAEKTKYVKVISPGDYFFDDQSLYMYFKLLEDGNSDLVFCRASFYTSKNCVVSSKSPCCFLSTHRLFMKRNVCLYHDYILGASIAAKTSLELTYLQEVSSFMKYVEDVPITFLALFEKKKVVFSKTSLIWYEYGTGISTSHLKKNKKMVDDDVDAFYLWLGSKNKSFFIAWMKAFRFAYKINSKFLKGLMYCILSPGYLVYKFFSLFTKKISRNANQYTLKKTTEGWE